MKIFPCLPKKKKIFPLISNLWFWLHHKWFSIFRKSHYYSDLVGVGGRKLMKKNITTRRRYQTNLYAHRIWMKGFFRLSCIVRTLNSLCHLVNNHTSSLSTKPYIQEKIYFLFLNSSQNYKLVFRCYKYTFLSMIFIFLQMLTILVSKTLSFEVYLTVDIC